MIVDDGSTDDSVTVAKRFEDTGSRSSSSARTAAAMSPEIAGVRAANAPLIAFLDSDDAYFPEKLERVVAEFDRTPDMELLVDSFIKVQPSGRPGGPQKPGDR